ncbi:MAG: hypothetical protein FH758_08455 [Firmicutes bacterium]|nr:hypothetical protein [Bacillota bacterium]
MQNTYLEKMEEKLRELDAEISKLSAKAKQTKEYYKNEYQKNLESLQEKQSATRAKFNEIKQSTSSAFEDTKLGFEVAKDDLEEALREAKKNFK